MTAVKTWEDRRGKRVPVTRGQMNPVVAIIAANKYQVLSTCQALSRETDSRHEGVRFA
jgi:hypothetical protein